VSEATADLEVPTWADLAPVGFADVAGATRRARLKPSRAANNRPCNRCANPYHTSSLRRPPARRSEPP